MDADAMGRWMERTRSILASVLLRGPTDGRTLKCILYLVDADYCEITESDFSGCEYTRIGDVPEPDLFDEAVEGLVSEGIVAFDGGTYRLLTPPDLSFLEPEERKVLGMVIGYTRGKTPEDVMGIVHRDLPWADSEDGEVLDLDLAVYRR